VVTIPTNRPMRRVNHEDLIYRTEREKYDAVVAEIEECAKTGRPSLVGTITIEKSEHLSRLLKRKGIRHQVLNASTTSARPRSSPRPAGYAAVTIATNMPAAAPTSCSAATPRPSRASASRPRGRRGAPSRRSSRSCAPSRTASTSRWSPPAGCTSSGTERHESRRIDNQLRGRSGRQGDPGSSRFFLSLEDDLMRIFGSDRISGSWARSAWRRASRSSTAS